MFPCNRKVIPPNIFLSDTALRLARWALPVELLGVDARSIAVRQRFAKAAIGWIRYKPLLTLITQPEKY
jgi:hypothetical protein